MFFFNKRQRNSLLDDGHYLTGNLNAGVPRTYHIVKYIPVHMGCLLWCMWIPSHRATWAASLGQHLLIAYASRVKVLPQRKLWPVEKHLFRAQPWALSMLVPSIQSTTMLQLENHRVPSELQYPPTVSDQREPQHPSIKILYLSLLISHPTSLLSP